MQWTFGQFMWAMFVVFIWCSVIWMFITIFADILRRDMSGWAKAGWIVLITILPFVGVLTYLITAPRTALRQRNGEAGYHAADEIAKAAHLHDQGRISAAQFDHIKEQALTR